MTVRAAIRRIIFAALGAVLAAMFLPAATAQMRGGFRAPSRGGRAFGSFGGHRRDSVPRGYFLGDTAFLYDDYPFAPAVPEDAPPQFGMLQKLPVEVVPPKIPSLLIELEGDQYVRYGGAAESSHRQVPAKQAAASKPSTGRDVSSLAGYDLPPTVLVFRDGHREEVADYAIVGTVMYAHQSGDQPIGGGLDHIQISALDLPATRSANRENGVSFVLPAGPNEIVTRP